MNPFDRAQAAESVYNFWLSLVPQLVKQGGSGADKMPPPTMPWMNALQFPADPIAAMAQMTQQSLQMVADATAPMMGTAAWPGMLAPSAGQPAGTTSTGKTIDQAWSEFGAKLGLPTNHEVGTAFDRTYATGDTIIPASCSKGVGARFGTKDYTELAVPGGHIGTFVGGKAQKILAPALAEWFGKRSGARRSARRARPRTSR